jgi:signal transduction histidine kinase
MGIPAEEIDKILETFYRAKNTDSIAGTGLGLSIVKRAVDLQNGKIYVTSKIDKGTTITVKIPINISERSAPELNFLKYPTALVEFFIPLSFL